MHVSHSILNIMLNYFFFQNQSFNSSPVTQLAVKKQKEQELKKKTRIKKNKIENEQIRIKKVKEET